MAVTSGSGIGGISHAKCFAFSLDLDHNFLRYACPLWMRFLVQSDTIG
jgi:hypothetical protein